MGVLCSLTLISAFDLLKDSRQKKRDQKELEACDLQNTSSDKKEYQMVEKLNALKLEKFCRI